MVDVKTPLSILHRPVRPIKSDFKCVQGTWAYLDSMGILRNIPTTSTDQSQPKVLKFVFNSADDAEHYEHHDIKSGRIATLEGIFRAVVDDSCYQACDTLGEAIVYETGMALTPAYRITSSPTSVASYSDPEDIGKLRPAGPGDLVVAKVENFDRVLGRLEFVTVSPRPYGGDDLWDVNGRGRLIAEIVESEGEGTSVSDIVGGGNLESGSAGITN